MAEEKKESKKHEKTIASMGSKKKKGDKKKSSKKKVHKIHVSRLASGGYLAEHEAPPGPMDPNERPEQHAIPDEQGLADHFAQHMPSGGDDEQAEGTQPASEEAGEGGGAPPVGPAGGM